MATTSKTYTSKDQTLTTKIKFTSVADGDNFYMVSTHYVSTSYAYSTFDLSAIPKGAKITSVSFSFDITAGTWGSFCGNSTRINGTDITASNANLLKHLNGLSSFGTLTIQHRYYANTETNSFGSAEPMNYTTDAKGYLKFVKLVISYEYEDDTVSYGVGGKWKKCKVYYGVGGKWVPCKVYRGVSGAWKKVK